MLLKGKKTAQPDIDFTVSYFHLAQTKHSAHESRYNYVYLSNEFGPEARNLI